MFYQPYAKIRTLRSRLGVAHLLVTQQAGSQNLQEVPVLVPASVVAGVGSSSETNSASVSSNTGFNAWI